MDATIRATCPTCHSSLKIPAQWAGQPVKCKKCGSVVRTKAPSDPRGGAAAPAAPSCAAPPELATIQNPSEREEPAPYPPIGSTMPGAPGMPGYPYPMPGYAAPPPGYPYPMPQPFPDPSAAAVAVDFKPSEALTSHRGHGRYRRGNGNAKAVWIGVCLLLAAGLVVGGIVGVKSLKQKLDEAQGPGTPPEGGGEPKPGQPGTTPPPGPKVGVLAGSGPNPRRFLLIHLSNYLYLNPLTAAAQDGKSRGPDITKSAAIRLSYEWRIPRDKGNDQLFILSDTATAPDDRKPMKGVLVGTYEKFFETSRAQDRIVVYFGGHVLAKDGKTYLVPIEGDPDEESSLVPLDDFYAKLKACQATQKVVIWDVCRYNPERGRQRPGSEPMSEEIAKALSAVPAGVQAVLTSQPGENALEFYNAQPEGPNKPSVVGSSFLAATKWIGDKNRTGAKTVGPDDPLPVADWAGALAKRIGDVATSEGKMKQTLKIAGAAPATLIAFNKEEAPATRFEYPPSPKSASPTEVAEIAGELNLPGIKSDDGESGVANFPFPADALAPYKSDVPMSEILANKEKYAFRIAAIDAYETIRLVWGKNGGKLREEFVGQTSDAVKKDILAEQIFPAEAIPRLDRAIVLLEAVEGMRANEPKRWQAHFDYAMAQCKARLAFMHEYNLALGNIRTEVLPQLDAAKGQDGYKLVSAEKLKVKKEAKYADEAKEIFEKIAVDYKGSPWAIQAKRDKSQSLGLAWQPFNSKAAAETKDP